MTKKGLIVFDMDGTLIRNTDSVALLCSIHGADFKQWKHIDEQEDSGKLSWIEADYERVKLFCGLSFEQLQNEFDREVVMIGGLQALMNKLKVQGLISVLITAGPIQVAEIVAEKYAFDYFFGSDYELENGKFAGRILNHLGSSGKLDYLQLLQGQLHINPEHCIAVGDGLSDVDLFMNIGYSIALNATDGVERYATVSVCTENIMDIWGYIAGFCRQIGL